LDLTRLTFPIKNNQVHRLSDTSYSVKYF